MQSKKIFQIVLSFFLLGAAANIAYASLCDSYSSVGCFNNSPVNQNCANNCGGPCVSTYQTTNDLCGASAKCCNPIFPTNTPTPTWTPTPTPVCEGQGNTCMTPNNCIQAGCNQCLSFPNNLGCINPRTSCCIVWTPTPNPATPTPTSIYTCEQSTYHGTCYNNSPANFNCANNCGSSCYSDSTLCPANAQCCTAVAPTPTWTPTPTLSPTPICTGDVTYGVSKPTCGTDGSGNPICVPQSVPESFSCNLGVGGTCGHADEINDYGCSVDNIGCTPNTSCPTLLYMYNKIGVKPGFTYTGHTYGNGQTCSSYSYYNNNFPPGNNTNGCTANTPTPGPPAATATPTPTFTPQFPIVGNVYMDLDGDHTCNLSGGNCSEGNYTLSSLQIDYHSSDNSINSSDHTTDGAYAFNTDGYKTYTVAVHTTPSGFLSAYPTSTDVVLNGSATNIDFGIIPLYHISGTVFKDTNTIAGSTNGTFDGNDSGLPGVTVNICSDVSCATIVHQMTTDANGQFGNQAADQILTKDTYYVKISKPSGYAQTTLDNYIATIGTVTSPTTTTCSSTNTAASCDTDANTGLDGSIKNMNFGLTNQIGWFQGICTDLRNDAGFTDWLPNTGTCDGTHSNKYAILAGQLCTNAGIVYSGNKNADFGPNGGQASQENYVVGGSSFAQLFSPVLGGTIRNSYQYILDTANANHITTTDLSAYCDTGSCTLPSNLESGIYTVTGNLSLVGPYTFPANKNIAILVSGDFTVTNSSPNNIDPGAILVPDGSTVIFAAHGNMYFDPTVGENSYTSYDATVEGWYVSDHNIIIQRDANTAACQSNGQPNDKRINIVGELISTGKSGVVQNERDLCIGDLTCPAYTVSNDIGNVSGNRTNAGSGLGYLLNTPAFLKHQNFVWQELNAIGN